MAEPAGLASPGRLLELLAKDSEDGKEPPLEASLPSGLNSTRRWLHVELNDQQAGGLPIFFRVGLQDLLQTVQAMQAAPLGGDALGDDQLEVFPEPG
jgi:hypothetical protein